MINPMNPKLTYWIAVLTVISITALFAGCRNTTDNPEKTTTLRVTPSASSSPSQSASPLTSETPTLKGETKRYTYQNLEVELTNVKSDRTETMTDDGGNEWKYTVITYYPGAKLTVIKADMSDPAYNADGKAHPQWGVLLDPADPAKRIEITDDMQPFNITSYMGGIYNLEASLYVFKFEEYAE
jgi:hypothetical protein